MSVTIRITEREYEWIITSLMLHDIKLHDLSKYAETNELEAACALLMRHGREVLELSAKLHTTYILQKEYKDEANKTFQHRPEPQDETEF